MVLNTFLWARQSVAAMPFGTIVALLVLWFIVCAPLNFVGSYCGFSKAAYEVPCTTHQIPRQIPPQAWYFSSELVLLLGGIFPFTSIFLEMYFVMSALWMHTIYYVFGFLFVAIVIL